jgi:hypothetical protein
VHSIKEAAVRTAESGSHSDIDVNEWLTPSDAQDVGDTRELNRNDTAELEMMQNTVINDDPPSKRPVEEPPTTNMTREQLLKEEERAKEAEKAKQQEKATESPSK